MPERGITGTRSAANITHRLSGVDFPAGKDKLVTYAKEHGAEPEVIDVLKKLPDREFATMADVMAGYGEE